MPSLLPSNAIPMEQITIAAASIGATYSVIGSFSYPIEMMIVTSTLDEAVQLSFDGSTDHVAVPAGDTMPVIFPINFKQNLMALPATAVSVKEIGNPTTGNLYISAFTAKIP